MPTKAHSNDYQPTISPAYVRQHSRVEKSVRETSIVHASVRREGQELALRYERFYGRLWQVEVEDQVLGTYTNRIATVDAPL